MTCGITSSTSDAASGSRRGLSDVIREIAAEQRSRGFPGRSADELRAEDDALQDEGTERDQELDAARRTTEAALRCTRSGGHDQKG